MSTEYRCSTCKTSKPIECFAKNRAQPSGIASTCKECFRVYRQNNKSLLNARNREYYHRNHGNVRKAANKNHHKRKITSRQYVLARNLRSRVNNFLKSKGIAKHNTTVKLLRCSFDDLKTYIESKFQDGMTWENKGEWHLDHIIPLSFLDLRVKENLQIVCHYLNLQPMWAVDNIRKSNKISHEEIEEIKNIILTQITVAGELLKCNIRLDGESKVGSNWYEVH